MNDQFDYAQIFKISNGLLEKSYTLPVPTEGGQSIDIALDEFDPADIADLIQFKVDGNGDIFFDNIFFLAKTK